MKVILECELDTGLAYISKVRDDGLVTNRTPVGSFRGGTDVQLVDFIEVRGWLPASELTTTDETDTRWAYIKPFIPVRFLGEVSDEEALTTAKAQGLPVTGVEGRLKADQQVLKMTTTREIPRDWVWANDGVFDNDTE